MHLTKGSCFNCCTDAVLAEKTAKKARKIIVSLFSVGNHNANELKSCTHSLEVCPLCYYQLELSSHASQDPKKIAAKNECCFCSKSSDLVALAGSEYFQLATEDYKLSGNNHLCTACLFSVHFRYVVKKNLLLKFPKLKSENLPQHVQQPPSPKASKTKLDLSIIKKMKPLSQNKRLGKAVFGMSDVKFLHQIPFVILELVSENRHMNRPRIKIKLKKSKVNPMFKSKRRTENWNAMSSTCEYDSINISSDEQPEPEEPSLKRKSTEVEEEDEVPTLRITKKGVLKERRSSNDNSPSPKKKKKRVSFKEADEIINDCTFNSNGKPTENGEKPVESRRLSYDLVVNLVNMKLPDQDTTVTENRSMSPDSSCDRQEPSVEKSETTEEVEADTSVSSDIEAVSMQSNAESDSDDGILQRSNMESLKLSDDDSTVSGPKESADNSVKPVLVEGVAEKIDADKSVDESNDEQSTNSEAEKINESRKSSKFQKKIKRRYSLACERSVIEDGKNEDQSDGNSENDNRIVENEDELQSDVPVASEHETTEEEADVSRVTDEENEDKIDGLENSGEIEAIPDGPVHNEEVPTNETIESDDDQTKTEDNNIKKPDKSKQRLKRRKKEAEQNEDEEETDDHLATKTLSGNEEAVSEEITDSDETKSQVENIRSVDEEVEATEEDTSTVAENTENQSENNEDTDRLSEKDESIGKEVEELAAEEESNGITDTSKVAENAENRSENHVDTDRLSEKDDSNGKELEELAAEEESNGITDTSKVAENAENRSKNHVDTDRLSEKDERNGKELEELDLIRKYINSGEIEGKTDNKNESSNTMETLEKDDLLSIIGLDETSEKDKGDDTTEQITETADDKNAESGSIDEDKLCSVNSHKDSDKEHEGDADDAEKLKLGEMEDSLDE